MARMKSRSVLCAATLSLSLLSAACSAEAVAPAGAAAPVFKHPGVLVSKARLDLIRKHLKQQPWKSAYADMKDDKLAKLTRKPAPRANVECGSKSHPNNGCSDERDDSMAAYTDALIWYLSKNPKYGYKAIAYMDAWSATIKKHTNSNAPLQSGWSGANWARAGEIIRYSVPKKNWPGQARFAKMLRTVYQPMVANGRPGGTNGNWELIMTDAAIGIAVYLDDRPAFNKAVAIWRRRLPAYVYLKSDGPTPVQPPGGVSNIVKFWNKQPTFVDGLTQETCRDLGHSSWGIAAATDVAQTAGIQGVNLFAEGKERLTKALEFQARYDLDKGSAPSWLCPSKAIHGSSAPGFELGYAAYSHSVPLPYTRKLILKQRPAKDDHFIAWETLTHATR